ncbi:hypothetical protein [Microcella sp.]|uniref:hypothetical protein n=1 Tax=Microcella sp. TaxID=1913979 RepID=UPI00299F8102|nr:hypothetical protein [Microcella sp.]MDX2024738.1 hypothetical protein [Microcella sp.]
MSRRDSRDAGALVLGGVPRANLMPPEVALQKKERGRRRGLITAVIAVVVLTVAGIVGSTFIAATAELRLTDERRTTEELLATQLEFSQVTQVRGQLESITEVRNQLGSVEVLWQDTISPYLAVLTPAETVASLAFEAETPAEPAFTLTGPLRSPRVATIRMVIVTAELPTPYSWYRAWEKLETFGDASIDSITLLESGYETAVTINLNDLARSQRFGDTEETE